MYRLSASKGIVSASYTLHLRYLLRLFLAIGTFLLFGSQHAIRGISLQSSAEAIVPIVGPESNFIAVDFDAADNYVYYADISSIFRRALNSTSNLSYLFCNIGW